MNKKSLCSDARCYTTRESGRVAPYDIALTHSFALHAVAVLQKLATRSALFVRVALLLVFVSVADAYGLLCVQARKKPNASRPGDIIKKTAAWEKTTQPYRE